MNGKAWNLNLPANPPLTNPKNLAFPLESIYLSSAMKITRRNANHED